MIFVFYKYFYLKVNILLNNKFKSFYFTKALGFYSIHFKVINKINKLEKCENK